MSFLKLWLILLVELLPLYAVFRLVKGKPREWIVWLVLTVVTASVGFVILRLGIGDSVVLQPNFFMVSTFCLLHLGNAWQKRQK